MKITDENYINIQGWMRTRLNLKGNELIVYALIYGFSQTEDQWFTGSLQYAADWCGASKQGILNNLKSLLAKKLIVKEEINNNGIKLCRYRAVVVNYVEYPLNTVERGIQHSLTNNKQDNKENNKENTLSKDKVGFDLKHSPKKTSKSNVYNDCVNEINLFTGNETVRQELTNYLKMRIKLKGLTLKGWQGILKNFKERVAEKDYIAAIQYSISKEYRGIFNAPDETKKFIKQDDRPMYEREFIEHNRYDNEDHIKSDVTF